MTNFTTSILILFLLIGLGSCESPQIGSENLEKKTNQENFTVSYDQALDLALTKDLTFESSHLRSYVKTKKLQNSKVIKDKDESEALFYIFNYEGGGFDIISADQRSMPVLAYSETNNIDWKTFLKSMD